MATADALMIFWSILLPSRFDRFLGKCLAAVGYDVVRLSVLVIHPLPRKANYLLVVGIGVVVCGDMNIVTIVL